MLLREDGISRIDNIMKTLQLRLLPLTLSSPSALQESGTALLPKPVCIVVPSVQYSNCVPLLWRKTLYRHTTHHGATRAIPDPCHSPATPDAERRLDRAMWPEKYTVCSQHGITTVLNTAQYTGRTIFPPSPAHLSLLLFLQAHFTILSFTNHPTKPPKQTDPPQPLESHSCAAPPHRTTTTRNPGR